jgi:hypothetical protein
LRSIEKRAIFPSPEHLIVHAINEQDVRVFF